MAIPVALTRLCVVRVRRFIPPLVAVQLALGCNRSGDDSAGDSGAGLQFADVTDQAGVDFRHTIGDGELSNLVESTGGGVAFLDFDQDGLLDIYLANGAFLPDLSQGEQPRDEAGNRLYHNRGDGTFTDVTAQTAVHDEAYSLGVAVGDYDNDGYPDIYVCNYGRNTLYHNDGGGGFVDVTTFAGVGDERFSVGAAWLDQNNDGLLDLYVGNYVEFEAQNDYHFSPDGFHGPLAFSGQSDVLFRNRGDGTFEDVTRQLGLARPDGRTMGLGAADYNEDGYVDIYVANDAMENYLFRNEGESGFREVALPLGVALNHRGNATSSMTVTFGDYDTDGHIDLFVPDMSYGALYRNEGREAFHDVTSRAGLVTTIGPFVGWAAALIDYDNDADVDIFQVNGDDRDFYGQEDVLVENVGDGRFVNISGERGSYFLQKSVGRGAAFGDYDNDGDLDVIISNLNDEAVLLRNDGGNRNSWLVLDLVGSKSNRDAVGARVTLTVGDLTVESQRTSASSYLSQNDHRIHFGIGSAELVDRIDIVWPSGIRQTIEGVAARQDTHS